MARRRSGFIIVGIGAALEGQLYAAIATRALTVKDWFSQQARELVAEHEQPSLLPKRPIEDSRR